MNEQLQTLLRELERFGAENDATATMREGRMRNIGPEVGAFLALLIRATKATRVLEIGTSNGYSTLWLAEAVRPLGGRVTTLEFIPAKAGLARANFDRSGLADSIRLHLGDAGEYLKHCQAEAFDFVFLDADREYYVGWWAALQRVLAPGGLMVVDNVISHADEVADFLDVVRATAGYLTSPAPLGKGEFLILKDGG